MQGVYFRASTRDRALDLGLDGWVRNLPDGSVEVLACGDEAALEDLREWLRRGPPLARVTEVLCEQVGDPGDLGGFEAR